jgi:hypothetical protein
MPWTAAKEIDVHIAHQAHDEALLELLEQPDPTRATEPAVAQHQRAQPGLAHRVDEHAQKVFSRVFCDRRQTR